MGGNVMIRSQQTRREFLKTPAALTATASFGAVAGRAAAQGGLAQSRSQIDALLRRGVEGREVPGVVAMAANDKGVIYEGAFGTRDLAKGPNMTLDTIFRLASMTKAVTSVAAMQLVEQGKLQLDQPIGIYFLSCRRRRYWRGSTIPAPRSYGPPNGRSRCGYC